MRAACLLLAMPLVHACAMMQDRAYDQGRSLPLLLTASTDSRVGGEALFGGKLEVRNNCLIVVTSNGSVLPIFDTSVRLADTNDAILDSTNGERIEVGEFMSAAAAHLRSDVNGWSNADIERTTGVKVPEGCGQGAIVRLVRIRKGSS